jgi:hypothetical protein
MVRKAKTVNTYRSATPGRGKKTCMGRNNVGHSTMNKNMKRSWKKYRGQG